MQPLNKPNSLKRVAMATMIGTAIEYFDNYIYAMAAVLVFNHQFFHAADPLSGQIAALSTLALTFIARPLGAVLFGHFGDRLGRKKYLCYEPVSNGNLNRSDRLITDLRQYRNMGNHLTLLVSYRSRHWFRWRMGRRCISGNRKCT